MTREPPVKTLPSFEEFLAFEVTSQERHEFVDGNLFVVAGGTRKHNLLALMLISILMQHALKQGFFIFNDVVLQTPTGRGYYPDAYITPQTKELDARVGHHPIIIIKVLSNSTEAIDRGEKWQAYQQIPSLEQYVLLSQAEPIAEVFSKDGTEWRYKKLEGNAVLHFPSLEFEMVLSTLYAQLPPLE